MSSMAQENTTKINKYLFCKLYHVLFSIFHQEIKKYIEVSFLFPREFIFEKIRSHKVKQKHHQKNTFQHNQDFLKMAFKIFFQSLDRKQRCKINKLDKKSIHLGNLQNRYLFSGFFFSENSSTIGIEHFTIHESFIFLAKLASSLLILTVIFPFFLNLSLSKIGAMQSIVFTSYFQPL